VTITTKTFWITEVDQPNGGPITKVCAFDLSERPVQIKSYKREQVVQGLKIGTILWTCYLSQDGTYKRGAQVRLTQDRNFITTKPNDELKDNLGELPACTC